MNSHFGDFKHGAILPLDLILSILLFLYGIRHSHRTGLLDHSKDERAAVDLVYKVNGNNYSLIELKVDSNSPQFATIAVLLYAMLFVWSKNNLGSFDFVLLL